VVIFMAFSGCRNYVIPHSMCPQVFVAMDTANMVMADVRTPFGTAMRYPVNAIGSFDLKDRKGRSGHLPITPEVEARIYTTSGRHYAGFFDQMYVSDSILFMPRGRSFGSFWCHVRLNEVDHLEVQNGGKRYFYIRQIDRPFTFSVGTGDAP
jgi:hypothetical protein